MKHASFLSKVSIATVLLGSCLFLSWQRPFQQESSTKENSQLLTHGDTSQPKQRNTGKNEYRIRDIDKAMEELDKGMKQLDVQMQKLDFSKMQEQLNHASEKIQQIDMDKMEAEIEHALAKVDFNQIRKEVDASLQEASMQLKQTDMKRVKEELERTKEQLKQQEFAFHINADSIKMSVEQGMLHAKEGMEKAKKELKQLKAFTGALEKDGLINTEKGYTIKVSKGKLIINGAEQPDSIYEKYKPYYPKDEFSIINDGKNISSL